MWTRGSAVAILAWGVTTPVDATAIVITTAIVEATFVVERAAIVGRAPIAGRGAILGGAAVIWRTPIIGRPTIIGRPAIMGRTPIRTLIAARGWPLAICVAQWIAVRWRERLGVAGGSLVVACADVLFEAGPLRFLRVLVFLSRIAMLAAWAPVFVARACGGAAPLVGRRTAVASLRSGAFPTAFALAEAGGASRIAGVEELPAFEPLHDGGGVFLAQAVECGQEFFGIVGAERSRLVVDEDGPIRVARGHVAIVRLCTGAGSGLRWVGMGARVRTTYASNMELVIAPIAELRARIAHHFEELVGSTLDRGVGLSDEPNMFTCGLTGGSTALIFLGALREASVDWSRITLYWGDERAVPPDSVESNYGLVEQMLLRPLAAKAPAAVRMQGELPDLQHAAREYAAALPPALDLLILGVGDDGHVCSLFPGHPALQEESARVLVIEDSPKPPPRRLTLSLSYVLRARQVWIVAVGERKRTLLQRAIKRKDVSTPVDLVVAQARSVTIFTDQVLSAG